MAAALASMVAVSNSDTDEGNATAIDLTATGFKVTVNGTTFNATGREYIYIAPEIRRLTTVQASWSDH